ncbi:unnamed protein product [Strongylus vulgaris]|uniref:Metaxin glutathione S-transferase domain-containing protein n=1 Tax=Strongylus vulgaris TaxID=40348 RepID=A0A3P7JTM3_STRVU|nr:unnamed protein product [Strongylus vulgaris]
MDQAVARAVDRLADNHTAWSVEILSSILFSDISQLFRVQQYFKVIDNDNSVILMALRDLGCPEPLVPLCAPLMGFFYRRKTFQSQASQRIAGGVGKLSNQEYKDLLRKDYDTYKTLIGQHKFLFGDEITPVDCTLFGQLATVLYLPVDSYAKDVLKEEYPVLVEYCDRIKDTAYGKDFTSM